MNTGKQRGTFISYSRSDKEFALDLARELKSAGYRVWLDQLDIPTGSRWDDEVEKALHECEIFLIILTPASISSNNVKDEIGYAIDSGKRILPILLEEGAVPLRLRRFQYVDFTKLEFSEGVKKAKQLIENLLQEQPTSALTINSDLESQTSPRKEVSHGPPLSSKNKPVQIRWVVYAVAIFSFVACLGTVGTLFALRDSIFPSANHPQPQASPAPTQTETAVPTQTNIPPTQTNIPPTQTNIPPTQTNIPPTRTNIPPMAVPTPTVNPAVPLTEGVNLRSINTNNLLTVYQDIYFHDRDGDVDYVSYQIIDITPGFFAETKNGSVDVPAEEQKSGGMFTGQWTCNGAVYDVTLSVTIYDSAGHESNSLPYTVNCQ